MNSILKTLFLALSFFLFAFSCSETSADSDPDNNNNQQEPPEETEKEWQLVWYDEFEGSEFDLEKWSYQLGDGCHISQDLCGWGNNELQYYTDREENIYIEDDMLHIVAHEERYEGMNYTSARIRTKDKGDWQYGRLEIRAKLPEGQGIWPAVWMLPTDNLFGGWPKSGEIDIMEMVGHEPETIHGTVHYGPDWPNNQYTGTSFTLDDGIFADDFHVFSIEWEQNEINWFVDGDHFFTVTPNTLSPHQYPFNARFHLLINLAVGGNWPGSPDHTTEFPQKLIVDYVRVYQFK
jgi:beta-glucanase (GH16 family)